MDILAYFKLYRRLNGGEWIYIYDDRIGLCHWVPTYWIRRNRWDYEYKIIDHESW